jgi:glycosyltransferase involved in cell wall biosynthesis
VRTEVLLSTHNGATWLLPQLTSVLEQTHRDLVVRVRDDGSTDRTCAVLEEVRHGDPRVDWTAGSRLGAAASFLTLLATVDDATEAAAFCDQDDVWTRDHLARALDVLAHAGDVATLWCSDVLVCDAELRPLHPHRRVRRRGPSFANALVENVATGCTIVLNRAAIDLLNDATPSDPVMHDAWCYLVVAAMGQVVYDRRPSVLYRLHDTNTMGLSRGRAATARARLRRVTQGAHVGAWTRQAAELRRLYGPRLPPPVAEELDRFLAGRAGVGRRVVYAVTGAAHRQRPIGSLGMRALYLLGRI